MHVLRWSEFPPWKTFLKERREAFARFDKAVAEAGGAKQRIDDAKNRALEALKERQADATR